MDLPILTSPKSKIALQVARKIAPCDRALREGVIFLAELLKFYVLGCFSWHLFQSFLLDARNAFW